MVSSLTNGLASVGSYFWGSNTTNTVTAGNMNAEPAPILTEEVAKKDIVKEGFLFK